MSRQETDYDALLNTNDENLRMTDLINFDQGLMDKFINNYKKIE